MKSRCLPFVALIAALFWHVPGFAQLRGEGLGGGIGFGHNFGQTELRDKLSRFHGRAFFRYGITPALQGELGIGLGKVAGIEYSTQIMPIDYRFVLSPFDFESWNPFLYAGFGALNYIVQDVPLNATPGAKLKGWTGYAPGGIGMQFRIKDNVALEMSGGFNYTLTDDLNAVKVDEKDAYWNYQVGVTVTGENPNGDPDKDGLTNREEKELGTDKKNPDSDGDGLTDGSEVKQYSTNPLKADSDADGLSDGDEVKTHSTNPNRADSDDDGLNDGSEINTHRTDANKADTDGDGLADGAELNTHTTNPLKADTDGDGLNDGDEVNRYRTNALNMDTDAGTVNDGAEVTRGTDPLNVNDDVPKKEVLKVEVGKAIVLDGIVFATGKSEISPESEEILEKAYNTLAENSEISVEIHGHTDNTGRKSSNMKLSQARADAVKGWLVGKGIAAERVGTKGFGPDKPIAPNTTVEGRQKNRRIEFFRTK